MAAHGGSERGAAATARVGTRAQACRATGIEWLVRRGVSAAVGTHGRAVTVGLDVVSVDTVARWIARYDDDALRIIFTPDEIAACRSAASPQRRFAICFAAKEAVGKALGLGLARIMWNEIQASPDEGALEVTLSGSAHDAALERGVTRWSASCARLRKEVAVVVLGESGGAP
jgi:holo-[acyl-carrier protein] synthase